MTETKPINGLLKIVRNVRMKTVSLHLSISASRTSNILNLNDCNSTEENKKREPLSSDETSAKHGD